MQPGLRLSDIAEELGGELTMSSDVPLLAGGYADVYQGIWTDPEGKKVEVAVKTLRASRPSSVTNDTAALKKRIDIVSPSTCLIISFRCSLISSRPIAYETRDFSMDSRKTQKHPYAIGF